MFTRNAHTSRTTLALVLLAFLAAVVWWWSVRAGRVDVDTAPTPIAAPAGAAAGAASAP
jgi:hypothetical protein